MFAEKTELFAALLKGGPVPRPIEGDQLPPLPTSSSLEAWVNQIAASLDRDRNAE